MGTQTPALSGYAKAPNEGDEENGSTIRTIGASSLRDIGRIDFLKAKLLREATYEIYFLGLVSGSSQLVLYPNLFFMKDVLKVESYWFTFFRTILTVPWIVKPFVGYVLDNYPIFNTKYKGWIVCFGLITLAASLILCLFEMTYWPFLCVSLLVNQAFACIDITGQSLAVRVQKIKKELLEKTAEDLEEHNRLQKQAIPPSTREYGNLVLARFTTKAFATFVGGFINKYWPIGRFYAVIATIAALFTLYSLFLFDEVVELESELKAAQNGSINVQPSAEEPGVLAEETQRDLITTIKDFWAILKRKELLLPTILMVLIYLSPTVYDPGVYYLTNHAGWTSADLSTNYLIFGVMYFFAMGALVNKIKGVSFKLLVFGSNLCLTLTNISNFRYIFTEELGFTRVYLLSIFQGLVWHLHYDLIMVPIVSRFSKICPKGLEGFGTGVFSSILYFAMFFGGLFGTGIIKYFGVGEKNYEDYYKPLTVAVSYSMCILLINPLLGK